uniref:Zinc finger protein 839 n=1 Tax=Rousettus aegyptiacus TaxID=9407 RepID=A0A7J8IVE9_ROUAE|nr:zinc finger protein 839 [Rousettus aegyptiacus]
MADAEPEAEDGGGGRGGSAVRLAPLGPEQLRRVLEQVTRAQPPAEPPAFVLQDAARRLRDAARQAALRRGPGAGTPRPPRLLPPQKFSSEVLSPGEPSTPGPLLPPASHGTCCTLSLLPLGTLVCLQNRQRSFGKYTFRQESLSSSNWKPFASR